MFNKLKMLSRYVTKSLFEVYVLFNKVMFLYVSFHVNMFGISANLILNIVLKTYQGNALLVRISHGT